MNYCLKYIITTLVILSPCCADAQQQMSFGMVPLQKQIRVNILGSDTTVFGCYNLYGYDYDTGSNKVQGEFIVLKEADTFRSKKGQIQIKFCRVFEFAMPIGNNCRNIPVESGIEIVYPGQTEKVFLNFDPTMPDAVFMPCK